MKRFMSAIDEMHCSISAVTANAPTSVLWPIPLVTLWGAGRREIGWKTADVVQDGDADDLLSSTSIGWERSDSRYTGEGHRSNKCCRENKEQRFKPRRGYSCHTEAGETEENVVSLYLAHELLRDQGDASCVFSARIIQQGVFQRK